MEKQRDSSWECENVQEPTFSLLQTLGMNALALFVLALLQILSKDHFINQTMFHICVRTDYEWKPCLLSKLFFQGRRSDKFWTDCHTLSFEGHILEVNTSCFITDITNRMCEINLSTCTRAKYNDHPQSTTSQTAFCVTWELPWKVVKRGAWGIRGSYSPGVNEGDGEGGGEHKRFLMAIDCICMQLHTYVLDEVEHKLASGDIAWEFFGSNEGKFGSKDGGGSSPSPRL